MSFSSLDSDAKVNGVVVDESDVVSDELLTACGRELKFADSFRVRHTAMMHTQRMSAEMNQTSLFIRSAHFESSSLHENGCGHIL